VPHRISADFVAYDVPLYFGNLSLIAPLANVVMLWAVPYAMLFGSLAVVVGLVSLPLGQLLALGAWPFLEWLLQAARLLSTLPWAATSVPPIAAGWVRNRSG